MTYQALVFTFGRGSDHPHETASKSSTLDLFLGESLVVAKNGLYGSVVREISVINEDEGSIRVCSRRFITCRPLGVGENSSTPA